MKNRHPGRCSDALFMTGRIVFMIETKQEQSCLDEVRTLKKRDLALLYSGDVVHISKDQDVDPASWSLNLTGLDVLKGERINFNFEQVKSLILVSGKEMHREQFPEYSFYVKMKYSKEHSYTFQFQNYQSAITAYSEFPGNGKVLGIISRQQECLELLKCIHGMNALPQGFREGGQWKNPYTYRLIQQIEAYLSENDVKEIAFRMIGNKGYLQVQTCENGYDYTFYGTDLIETDGGRIDILDGEVEFGNPWTMYRFVMEILRDYGYGGEKLEVMDYSGLLEQVEG